jgi:hypothetical protein
MATEEWQRVSRAQDTVVIPTILVFIPEKGEMLMLLSQ